MGTRYGDIDASLVSYIMEKEGISDIKEMVNILNNKSGLLGLSGVSSDMRDVESAAADGNHNAQTAIDIFYDRVQKYIASYIAVMGGVDAIVFTAGIGENSASTRAGIINEQMDWFGIRLDADKNDTREEAEISAEDSRVKLFTIPTDEELMIVRDTVRLGNITD